MQFPFPCPKCGKDVCRRAYTINLALGYADEQVCLNCLSVMHEQDINALFDFIYEYVQSRDCFKKEWIKMKERTECPLPTSCVINKCFVCSELLDLRGVECPLNFVKTKIQLEKMQQGAILEILLDAGEAVESVSSSVIEEGHKILVQEQIDNYFKVIILKN